MPKLEVVLAAKNGIGPPAGITVSWMLLVRRTGFPAITGVGQFGNGYFMHWFNTYGGEMLPMAKRCHNWFLMNEEEFRARVARHEYEMTSEHPDID
jgi:hypothetical protein